MKGCYVGWNLLLAGLSLQELHEARVRGAALTRAGAPEALACNASLLAQALRRGKRRAFFSGREVLARVSPGKIENWAGRWATQYALSPAPDWGELEELKNSLAHAPMARLQFRVLRAFGVLPTEERARAMTREDFLWCAAQLLRDDEEELEALCPACRQTVEEPHCPLCGVAVTAETVGENGSFDMARYAFLAGGGTE